jgi:hypothetical protein
VVYVLQGALAHHRCARAVTGSGCAVTSAPSQSFPPRAVLDATVC